MKRKKEDIKGERRIFERRKEDIKGERRM